MNVEPAPEPSRRWSTPDAGPVLPEPVAELFGSLSEAVTAALANEPPGAAEQRLRRIMDREPVEPEKRPGTVGTDADGAVPSAIMTAERAALRIVADAHRRADDIVTAARRRAAEHTSSAVRESVRTLIDAQLSASRVNGAAQADPLPQRLGRLLGATEALAGPGLADKGDDGAGDLAVRWASALRRCAGPLAPSHGHLAGLLPKLISQLDATAAHDPAGAEQVGQALVRAGLFQPELLGCTLEVLIDGWPSSAESVSGEVRATVLAAVATGFAEQLRSQVRDHQEALQQALFRAREQVDLSLRTTGRRRRDGVALFDPLTGLPNQDSMLDRLDAARTRAGRGRQLGMCVLDLAGFKSVNDSFGSAVGDRVLARIARRLTAVVGEPEHLVARLGSDEFALLIEDSAGAAHLMEVAERALAKVADPISLDTCRVSVTGRVGLAEAPASATTAGRLLRHAKIALGHARDRDTCMEWFQPGQQIRPASSGHLAAVDVTDFDLRYDRIVALREGTIRAVEVHVRYQHPLLRELDPDQVTDLAGDSSWLPNLFTRMLDTACQAVASWKPGGHATALHIALPVTQISPRYLIEQIDRSLHATGLPAARLSIDVPETFAVAHADLSHSLLGQLAARGIQVGINDVGLGFTTLAYLRSLPVTRLTLHPSLTTDLDSPTSATGSEAVLRAMVSLAHSLHLSTVAQSVGSARAADRLQALGLDLAQGRHYGDPFSAADAPTVFAETAGTAMHQHLS